MIPDWDGLTVARLIATLSGMPGDMPVVVRAAGITQLLEVVSVGRGQTMERHLINDQEVIAVGVYCVLEAHRLAIDVNPKDSTD
ncbi:hypothetical protein [Mycobacterium sp.]|uniref:hypothetical protein n=1 Tax=Mycobacterium sp. TaxID=1785 RepID=UPI003F9D24CE